MGALGEDGLLLRLRLAPGVYEQGQVAAQIDADQLYKIGSEATLLANEPLLS